MHSREPEVMSGAKIKLHGSYLGLTYVYETKNESDDEVSYENYLISLVPLKHKL